MTIKPSRLGLALRCGQGMTIKPSRLGLGLRLALVSVQALTPPILGITAPAPIGFEPRQNTEVTTKARRAETNM
eukprot:362021-Chlamydomonas_euryale.AAC.3